MGSFDPKKKFVSTPHRAGKVERDSDWNNPERGFVRVPHQAGQVQKDSDWNNPARGGRRIVMKVFSVKGLLIAGIFLVLVAGGAAVALWLGLPAVQDQIPAAPMIVTLNQPANGSGAGAGSPVHVSSQVVASHAVISAELWVDNFLAGQTAPIPVATNVYAASLEWTPTPGAHVLIIRATDDQGHIGLSNIVRVDGRVATDSMAMEPFVARGGEMPAELAETYGTTLDEILRHNPELHEQRPLSAGQEVLIPIPAHYEATWGESPPDAPLPQNIGVAAAEISPLGFWFGTAFSPAPPAPPAPSGLSAAAAGCDVSLAIDDNSVDEAGFFLYRLGPSSPAFERIATLGPHDGEGPFSYLDAQLSGTYHYYAAAFNSAGESPGAMVKVTLPSESCGTTEWGGDLSLAGNLLVSPIVADQAYFYASVNGGQWRRVPHDPNSFLPAVQGGYDVSPYLADLTASAGGMLTTLSLDGWGWGGGALLSIGQGSLTTTPQMGVPDVGGLYLWTALQGSSSVNVVLSPSTKLPMYFSEEVVFTKPANFAFRWKTGSPGATSGRWEVSRSPYFLPSLILGEGVAEVKSGPEGYSYFNIPFDDLLALTANIGDQAAAPLMQGPVAFGSEQALNLEAGQSVALSQPLLPAFGAGGGQITGEALAPSNLPPIAGGVQDEYYVRLTPMIGNQIAGESSNTVIARYDPEAVGGVDFEIPYLGPEYYTPLYEVEILDYTQGAMENGNDWGCVTVVKVIPGSMADTMFAFEVNEKICPEAWSGDNAWYDKLGEDLGVVGGWLEKGLEYAAKAWQDIKAFAIKTLMKVTGLEAVCELAEDAVLPEGACYTVVSAAVDVGLASMGIPPTLPNFDKLMDEGLDYAVELAAQEALKELPGCVGPCADAVKDKLREALEAGIDAVAGQSVAPSCVSEDEAHAHGREPWCPPDGLIVKPSMGSVDSPPAVLVRLTRRADVPDPANLPVCNLSIDAVYTISAGGWTKDNPQFSASPFTGRFLAIPPLAPGESIDVAVALNGFNVVDFPWESYIGSPWAFHDAFTMVWSGTSHGQASASFVIPPGYAQSSPPAPCAPVVIGEEKGAQGSGWKLK